MPRALLMLQVWHRTWVPPLVLPGMTWSSSRSLVEPHHVHHGCAVRAALLRRWWGAPYIRVLQVRHLDSRCRRARQLLPM